jgi:benzylsuccinate CoA-transferase BbsE subunit
MSAILDRPYDGLRIIDLGGELSAYATRLFADLGAEVIMVEPPGGRAERQHNPLPEAERYGGAPFAFLNAGKKSVALDWHTPAGADALAGLVASAQVVVLETDAKFLLPSILAVPGKRIVTVVSHFGLDGPYADYLGSDLVTQSLGGIAWLSGVPGEPPLRLPGEQAAMVTSVYAAAATALAVWDLEMHGHGHLIDVSAQECIAHSLQNAPQVWDLERRILSRGGEGIRDATEDLFACKDGHVFLAAPLSLPMSWKAVVDWLKEEGDPGYACLAEPDWANRPLRATAPMKKEFRRIFESFIANKTRVEMRDEALRRKIVMAPVSRVGDLAEDPQLIFRNFFTDVAHPTLGRSLRFPGAPYRLSEPVWRIDRAAPSVGEHGAELTGAPRAAAG